MKRITLLVCLAFTACREAPGGFEPPDPFGSIPPAEAGRLTWNFYEDHSPVWNATSDSVYYSARSYPGFPVSGGLLLSVPRTPGRAALILESLQRAVAPQPWLAAPAVSPNGQSIAFVELTDVHDPTDLCNAGVFCETVPIGSDTGSANILLRAGMLRVRPLNGGSEASIPIVFDGFQPTVRTAHPFQRQYERDGAEVFRPSWSPDGTRLVFSDGLQLYIWTIGEDSAVAVPNTEDGVWPAWSPDGSMIAFTRLQRGAITEVSCSCMRIGRPLPVDSFMRVVYNDGGRRTGTLTLIRPDGTDMQELGEGEAPAWTPDGQFLVFQRNNQLWRSAANGANADPIPNTAWAYEPAISPNGRFLTFSRNQYPEDRPLTVHNKPYDIWVVDF